MKIGIEFISSVEIRDEMAKDSYTTEEFLGTYVHPHHSGPDWEVRLYQACDTLVFETNGDPVWKGNTEFDVLKSEYGVVEI